MAANPTVAPQAERVLEKKTLEVCDRRPLGLKQRVRDRLIEIFEGYEEFLGWTPD
jgi:hypothetical protein